MEGAVSLLVDVNVVQDLAVDMSVVQVLPQNHTGERMTSLVDVMKESVDLGLRQPLVVFVLLKVAQPQQRFVGMHMTSSLHSAKGSVSVGVMHNAVRTKPAGSRAKNCH